jgi:hypothetical protein
MTAYLNDGDGVACRLSASRKVHQKADVGYARGRAH